MVAQQGGMCNVHTAKKDESQMLGGVNMWTCALSAVPLHYDIVASVCFWEYFLGQAPLFIQRGCLISVSVSYKYNVPKGFRTNNVLFELKTHIEEMLYKENNND